MKKLFLLAGFLFSTMSYSATADFTKGPVFTAYGENALVDSAKPFSEQQKFKVAFDVFKKNEGDSVLRDFNSVARFINMHVRAGVPLRNIEVAVVVHGGASFDLMNRKSYLARFGKNNPSADLIEKMLAKNVKVYLCGQSAAYHGINLEGLQKGVEMSLSAMTAHAILQQNGFSLNPF